MSRASHTASSLLVNGGRAFFAAILAGVILLCEGVTKNITTGRYPAERGIVANGLFDRDTYEVAFWQSIMYVDADILLTPRPLH